MEVVGFFFPGKLWILPGLFLLFFGDLGGSFFGVFIVLLRVVTGVFGELAGDPICVSHVLTFFGIVWNSYKLFVSDVIFNSTLAPHIELISSAWKEKLCQ